MPHLVLSPLNSTTLHSLSQPQFRKEEFRKEDGDGGGDLSPFHNLLLASWLWMLLLWKSKRKERDADQSTGLWDASSTPRCFSCQF